MKTNLIFSLLIFCLIFLKNKQPPLGKRSARGPFRGQDRQFPTAEAAAFVPAQKKADGLMISMPYENRKCVSIAELEA